MDNPLNREECRIVWNTDRGYAVLVCRGRIAYDFPFHWTEAQIWEAFCFASQQYEAGYAAGMAAKAAEIRRALGSEEGDE